MITLLVWIMFCVLVGVAAQSRNRNAFGWGTLAFCITPVLALALLVILGKNEEDQSRIASPNVDWSS
jgi:predicted membrane metal-binding protein